MLSVFLPEKSKDTILADIHFFPCFFIKSASSYLPKILYINFSNEMTHINIADQFDQGFPPKTFPPSILLNKCTTKFRQNTYRLGPSCSKRH